MKFAQPIQFEQLISIMGVIIVAYNCKCGQNHFLDIIEFIELNEEYTLQDLNQVLYN